MGYAEERDVSRTTMEMKDLSVPSETDLHDDALTE